MVSDTLSGQLGKEGSTAAGVPSPRPGDSYRALPASAITLAPGQRVTNELNLPRFRSPRLVLPPHSFSAPLPRHPQHLHFVLPPPPLHLLSSSRLIPSNSQALPLESLTRSPADPLHLGSYPGLEPRHGRRGDAYAEQDGKHAGADAYRAD